MIVLYECRFSTVKLFSFFCIKSIMLQKLMSIIHFSMVINNVLLV